MNQSYRTIGVGIFLAFLAALPIGCTTTTQPKKLARAPVPGVEIDRTLQAAELSNLAHEEDSRASVEVLPVISGAVSQALMASDELRRKAVASEPRFDIHVNDVNAQSFFTGLVDGTPYNMVVHPGVTGNITLNLTNVTVKDVLETVRDIYGYEYSESRIGFEIRPIALQTRIYPLNYLSMKRTGSSSLEISSGGLTSGGSGGGGDTNSSKVSTSMDQDVWKEVEAIVKSMVGEADGRRVAISPQSGVVIVRAMPEELRRVEDFLLQTQKTINRQVVLEAKVLEVSLNDAYQQGIDWGLLLKHFNLSQLSTTLSVNGVNSSTAGSQIGTETGSIKPTQGAGAGLPGISAISPFGGMFAATAAYRGFNAFVELLNQQGNVQVLSSPRVSALNNQKAIIKIGTDQYYVTNVTSNTNVVSGVSTTSNNVTFSPFFSGIALDVTPFIDGDDSVTLHVHPSIVEVTGGSLTVAGQSYPLASSTLRESDTVVRAHSGQIVVIGGLMKHEAVEENTSIPWIGDIPFVGNLFRQSGQSMVKQELVILLRPTVIGAHGWSSEIHDNRERFKNVDRGFHYGGRDDLFGHEAER